MSWKKLAANCLVILCVMAVGFAAFVLYAWYYYTAPGPLTGPATVIVANKTGVRGIAAQLAETEVISQPNLFTGLAIGLGRARKFQAGEYLFTAGTSPQMIMQMMDEGKVVVHKITVPEGLKVREVVALLDNEPLLTGHVPESISEGSLMPQTYRFDRGESRAAVIKRMQEGMTTLVAQLWSKHQPGLLSSAQQAVTLASIVEKETGVQNERGHVASVFLNRLKISMKLQSDPTVVYGMEKAMGAPLGRSLTTEDLHTFTPYNTYMIEGLPPGPIANPGQASLEAVMNPPDTRDLYFVATGKGGHSFAASLAEHNHNVETYRQQMRVPHY